MPPKALIISAFVVTLFHASPGYAYLDPGTGSMILQGIVGGIAASFTVLAIYWGKVKAFFSRTRPASDQDDDGSCQ